MLRQVVAEVRNKRTPLAGLGWSAVHLVRSRFHSGDREEKRSQDSSKTHVRYAVRQKRADARSALKNLLINGKPVQLANNTPPSLVAGVPFRSIFGANGEILIKTLEDQTQRQKKLKNRQSSSIKEKRRRKRGCIDGEENGNFTWTWAGETFTFVNSSPNGFQWRDDSNWHQNQSKKFWNESDVEDEGEERSNATDLLTHRATLGLPRTGPLGLDDIKSAFRSAALKWHPDKHEGSSKEIAGEKFKLCVDAYKALSLSLTQQR